MAVNGPDVVAGVVEAVELDDPVEAVPPEDEAVEAVESLAADVDADFESLPHAARTAAAPMPTIAPRAARRLKEGSFAEASNAVFMRTTLNRLGKTAGSAP